MNKTEFLGIIEQLRQKIHTSLEQESADIEKAIALAVQKECTLDVATKIALLELLEEENLFSQLEYLLFANITGTYRVTFGEDNITIAAKRGNERKTAALSYELALKSLKITKDN